MNTLLLRNVYRDKSKKAKKKLPEQLFIIFDFRLSILDFLFNRKSQIRPTIYFLPNLSDACAAARRAIGTLKGEQLT